MRGGKCLHFRHCLKPILIVYRNSLAIGNAVLIACGNDPEYILLRLVHGKEIFQPMRCGNGIVGEVDDVLALCDMTGYPPPEVIVYVVLQIDFLLVRQAVKIRLRSIRRAIVDRNEFNIAM